MYVDEGVSTPLQDLLTCSRSCHELNSIQLGWVAGLFVKLSQIPEFG